MKFGVVTEQNDFVSMRRFATIWGCFFDQFPVRYSKQLRQLNRELIKKRPQIVANRRKVMLLHDNTRFHIAKESKEALLDLKWEILPYSAYSLDIVPSDYHLIRSMQHTLSDERFSNAEDIWKWVNWKMRWLDRVKRWRIFSTWYLYAT